MAVSVARALSARLPQSLDLKLPPTSDSTLQLLQKCVGHAYDGRHDETFAKTLKSLALPSLDIEEAPPSYNDCINDCPPDYTNTDSLATLSVDPPAYAPSICTSQESREEKSRPTEPRVDFGYRDNLREHKKKKKGAAAAKNKWDSDNEEEKKPEGDNNADQPGDAGNSGGADGAGGGGEEGGNDDDDWDDGKKKGKKDKKKSAFSWGALDDDENKDEEEKKDDPPAEEAPAEEDEWAGFTTAASKKKKKKGQNVDPDPPPDDGPPKVDVDFGNSNSFSFGSNGAWGAKPAEDDGWATFGTSKKDKKKKTNAFDFGFGDADGGEMPGESAPLPAEEETKTDDNPWAAFGTGKKKKKGGAAEELPAPEPEPEAVVVQSPDEPADDFSWGMSAKDKKKAKKAAKAAALVEPEPEPEPEPVVIVEETMREPEAAIEPEPAPVEDFSWGMSAKDKKKAKKAAKKAGNAFEFIAEPEPEPTPVPEPETKPPVVEVVEDPAPPAAEPEPVDDFSWGMSAKDKKKAKKAAKKSAFDWSEPDPPAAPDPPPAEETPTADDSTALAIPEPPQDDWLGWGTASKKKDKKIAEEVPPEVPPPPPAAPKPAVEESSSSWSFGWGSSSKKDKKKSKSPEPEPVPVPEPVLEKDPVVMIPESIDEPKVEEDDWAGWATGKKSKKKGSKTAPVEIVEPVYDVPVQQPDPAPAEEDAWTGWSVGKKEKKKSKKGDDIPPPPLPAIEPPPMEVIESIPPPPPEPEPTVEQAPADDPWASFSTKKSKKDKKKKGSSAEEPKPVAEAPPAPPEPEQLLDVQEPEIEPEPIIVIESPPAEEPVKEVKKKEVKTSSGWGSSLWGSSSKSKSSSKDKEKEKEKEKEKKEKEEKERLDREAEEQRKADEEAAFAAALADEPVDLLLESEPVIQEPTATGYWGTFLKPTTISKTVEEPIVHKGKVDTGAKESVKDRIKRLQGEATKDKVVVVPHAPLEPELLPEPEIVVVPEAEVIIVPEPPVAEEAPAKKSSKDKKKKKGKEKEPSPPPPPAAIEIPPPVVGGPPSLSPIPGGFPEDDVDIDVLADVPAVPPAIVVGTSVDAHVKPPRDHAVIPPPTAAVIPSEEVMPKSSSDKKVVKDKKSSVKKEVKKPSRSSRPTIVDLAAPSTPAAESKSEKKERPKVVRDPTGRSHWGLWGTTPKAEPRKEHRPSKDTTTPTAKRSAAPGLTRSKSARKPNERDFMDKADKTSSDDKPSKRASRDPSTPAKGMGFSLFGPTPTRSRSVRQSTSTQRPSQVRESRRSLDVSAPPGDIASKAAKFMGLGPRPSLSRSQSTREKRKSRTVPDPYAIDSDNTPDDATHSASVDRSSSHRTKRSSRSDHKHNKRDSAMMSGGLGPSDGDGADPLTAPEDTPFVTPSRPMLKRSATTSAKKPAGGLFSNIIESLRPKPVEELSRRHRSSRAYDSEDGSTRHHRHRTPHSSYRDEDEDTKRHLRREHRRVHRPEDAPSTPLDEYPRTPAAENTESEDRERRRAERRAKRAALEAAEEDLRAREKATRRREREDAERARQDEEEKLRRQRRAERHASRRSSAIDADRKPHLHRSSTAPVQSYFDSRAPNRDANGRDLRSPPKDKTSSWVHSVTSSPPLPPPLQPTILDVPPTDPAADDAELRDDESTARELRRRHRRQRESLGVETEEDRKKRKRKELRRREEELAFRNRENGIRKDGENNKAYNSLGYDGFETQRTWDGRVVGSDTRGGVKEEIARRTQGWFKKVAGL
ncbi:hypothetical protein E4T49_02827 [Aureobasidium sp. EXF-10728]|nr:hypothetical protein E4T49_02827 [Aureobasidium sp. EXF-10728]